MVCKDDGNSVATVARTKTDEYGVEMVSPKMDKASMDGDSEELNEDVKLQILYAHSVANGCSKFGASPVYEA